MGQHSKSPAGYVGPVLDFLRRHRKVVLTVVPVVLTALVARYPDFPAQAVLGAVHLVLGG